MSKLSKLKMLFSTGQTTALKSESLKSHKEVFDSGGRRYAGVYVREGLIYFRGAGEYETGREVSWYPFFVISENSNSVEKGLAVLKALSGFTINIKCGDVKTGDIKDSELLKLSGLDNISKFYRKARYCRISQNRDNRLITFLACKRNGRGGSYSGLDFESQAPEKDPEAIASALDAAISASIG